MDGGVRTSLSMNDLLLFGGGDGEGRDVSDEVLLPPPATGKGKVGMGGVGLAPAGPISPLELDMMELDLDFDFQLGSPVSPLSPSPRGGRVQTLRLGKRKGKQNGVGFVSVVFIIISVCHFLSYLARCWRCHFLFVVSEHRTRLMIGDGDWKRGRGHNGELPV